MPLLRDDFLTRERLKGSLATTLSNLDHLEAKDAQAFICWTMQKSKMYADSLLQKKYPTLPDNIQRGDIVLCSFGINIFPEFSDKETGKHFGVVWAQQGHNFLIIPITQQAPHQANPYCIPLGPIPFLTAPCNYAKIDAIRSVSLRRVSRISGAASGKIVFPFAREKINEAFMKLLIDK